MAVHGVVNHEKGYIAKRGKVLRAICLGFGEWQWVGLRAAEEAPASQPATMVFDRRDTSPTLQFKRQRLSSLPPLGVFQRTLRQRDMTKSVELDILGCRQGNDSEFGAREQGSAGRLGDYYSRIRRQDWNSWL